MKSCRYCPFEVHGLFLVCESCKKKRDCEKQKNYQKRNKEKVYERQKKYRAMNPHIFVNRDLNKKKSNAKCEFELRDHVVVKRLGLTKETAPKNLINMKREQLLLRREIFELNKTIKELKNGN